MTFEYYVKDKERRAYRSGEEAGEARGLELGRSEGEKLGLERGRSEGLERGAAQKEREIAKRLKCSGISIDVIAANTGLSAAEIQDL